MRPGLPDARPERVDQTHDVLGGREPPLRGIADDEQPIDVARGLPADVLHAGLVVDDDAPVGVAQAVDGRAQHVVGGAVAARAFGPAHGEQVEVVALDHALLHLVLEPVRLGDARLERAAGHLVAGVLADLADGLAQIHAQRHVEVGAGVGVDGEDRSQAGLAAGT